jgi:hypothetical protein
MDINSLFTPFNNKELCFWFYLLSVSGIILLVMTLVSGIYFGLTQKKSVSFFFSVFFVSISYFILYFQNRLLYSMCVKTI